MTKIPKTYRVLTAILFLTSLVAFAQPVDPIQGFRILSKEGTGEAALATLQKKYDDEKVIPKKAKMAFALGVFSYKIGKLQKAGEFLNGAIQMKTRLDDYAHYYLGLVERDLKDLKGAKKHFQTVRSHQPPSLKEVDAEIQLAEIARTQGKWREAFDVLAHMERKHKKDYQYPDILYSLVEASLNAKKNSDACRAAIALYSKFPNYTLSKKWGFDLNKVKISNFTLHCLITPKDHERRIQRLLITGDFDEVKAEMQEWLGTVRGDGKGHPEDAGRIQMLYGQYALAEGKVKDAITHFQSAQDILGRNFDAQMYLAKAHSQTENYAAAVEGYLHAYELNPRSKLGQKALFQAAFLSYQNRDYDGASRRFEEVTKRARGAIAWDARWHLAWIRYLKADYIGAKKEFAELARSQRMLKPADAEKLAYWTAMAELRDGNPSASRAIFTQLAGGKRLGYYSAAAQARLATLPEPSPTPRPAELKAMPVSGPAMDPPKPTPAPSPKLSATVAPTLSPTNSPAIAPNTSPATVPTNSPVQNPSASPGAIPSPSPTMINPHGPIDVASRHPASSDEGLGGEKDAIKDQTQKEEEEEPGNESQVELPEITPLKSPSLQARFERAQDLVELGFDQFAVQELREVERRTSNRTYLQTLMSEYLRAGDYYRSAYIADVVFEAQREKAGVDAERNLWTYAFPQAFDKFVSPNARKFDVPRALVWAVMRGESGFREDVHSTAGAMGLMQMIPPTARKVAKSLGYPEFANSMLLNPELNVMFGARYLKRLSKSMSNNLPLVIASYNAGPHRVLGWLKDFGDLDLDEFIEHIPYLETRNYVKKVLRNYFVYLTLYEKQSQNPLKWLSSKPTIKFSGPKPTSESWDTE